MTELRDTLQPEPADTPVPAAADAQAGARAKGEGGGSREEPPGQEPMHSDAGNFALKEHFCVREADLSERLGVNRRGLCALRGEHLLAGVDFVKIGRARFYCDAGVQKLAAAVNHGAASEGLLPSAGLSEASPAVQLFNFTVRRKAANTKVLECTDENGKTVIVRVRDSLNFLPGMPVSAAPYGDLHNVYEFAGAYPRFRGKY